VIRPALLWTLAAALPAAGDPACASCHPKQTAGFARSGMANSLGRPADQPGGSFAHAPSGSRFTIAAEGGMRHRVARGGLAAEYPVEYFIGSGRKGHSYLVRLGDYLFQSPASYYTARAGWAVSPGYDADPAPDFDRPVTTDCLFCHAGRARPVAGTLNRYQGPPFAVAAISCERCHGPAETHLARPAAGNIVNPAKLPPRARDSVCEQCHLAGEARIPNPGREFPDFQPGREMEEVFAVYVDAAAGNPRVTGHAEQLGRSACARASAGRLWCGSCHDPHEPAADPARYYRERCLACHGAGLLERHARPVENCAGCHMPRRPASDIPHTSVTDHRITRRSHAEPAPAPSQQLAAWREPPAPLAQRNLGLAYVSAGERHGSAPHRNEGFRLLTGAEPAFPKDAPLLTALGHLLLLRNRPVEAVRFFERALDAEPAQAAHHVHLAAAQQEAGQSRSAIRNLERALALDPSLARAYRLLAGIYGGRKQPVLQRQVLERYLRFAPQNLEARRALASTGGP